MKRPIIFNKTNNENILQDILSDINISTQDIILKKCKNKCKKINCACFEGIGTIM